MKIIVGARNQFQFGFASFRQEDLDITYRASWARLFHPGTVDVIVCEHVLEHLDNTGVGAALLNFYEFLAPGGRARIAVPDGLHPDPTYIEWVRPGSPCAYARDHRQLFTYKSLTARLSAAGFPTVEVLEAFDEAGRFYHRPIDGEHGHIRRTTQHIYGLLLSRIMGARYTSLVIDAIKPKR